MREVTAPISLSANLAQRCLASGLGEMQSVPAHDRCQQMGPQYGCECASIRHSLSHAILGSSNAHEIRRRLALTTLMLMLACLTGCTILPRLFGNDHAAKRAQELQELQTKGMRFADEYVGRMIGPIAALQTADSTATERLAAQAWKVSQATSAYTIASGSNPHANALDFVVLATLSRMAVEDQWVGGHFGERARPLYDVHRRLETIAWELVADVLNDVQKQQLRSLIDTWRARNPKVEAVAYIHFATFAHSIEQTGEPLDTSMLSLVGLDPLANLDPAVHQIAQTRELAERAIYYAQRSPYLLEMQVERLTYQLAVMPETGQILADVGRTSRAAEQAGNLASALPTVLAREREATIEQFVTAFSEQQRKLRTVVIELRQTLEAGTATSDSLNATIRSLDTLVARFKGTQPSPEQALPPSRPFNIVEYAEAAREFAKTTRDLEGLIRTLDSGAPGVVAITHGAFADAKYLVNYIFWHIAGLLLLLVVLLFAAALAYRVLFARIGPHGET
ncbi:MAG: hypothetical protein JWM63_1659 [Gammaproteobacteria bacterium]|nr:hypothetical protein [Gammaproteobacteria bacterium]